MASFLKITRHPYEEPHHLNLVVQVSNGTQTGSLEIYTTPEALLRSAEALRAFPRHSTDVFLWEIGSERPEDRWAFYFRFRVFLNRADRRVHDPLPLQQQPGSPRAANLRVLSYCGAQSDQSAGQAAPEVRITAARNPVLARHGRRTAHDSYQRRACRLTMRCS